MLELKSRRRANSAVRSFLGLKTDMRRHFTMLAVASLLFVLAIAVGYFGPRYELHKFDANARAVLTQTGEDLFLGLRWLILAVVLFVLGIITTVIGLKGLIENHGTRRS